MFSESDEFCCWLSLCLVPLTRSSQAPGRWLLETEGDQELETDDPSAKPCAGRTIEAEHERERLLIM